MSGLSALASKIPGIGGLVSGLAPLAQAATSLLPGGAAVNAALDLAGGVANKAIDANKQTMAPSQDSAIIF